MKIDVFRPGAKDTAQLSAGTSTSRVAIDTDNSTVRVYNAGPDMAYLVFGTSTITATTAKMPIPVGSAEPFDKGAMTHAAAICDEGKSALLFFTPGEGI